MSYDGVLCYGGILCVMVVYSVLWRCTLCYGGVLYGTVVYCVPTPPRLHHDSAPTDPRIISVHISSQWPE